MSSYNGEQPAQQGLTVNILSSNNPFRNRAASPASPFDDPPPRPVSRNPFLEPPPPVQSPGAMLNHSDHKSLSAEEIFNSLTLDDKPSNELRPAPPTQPPPRRPVAPPAAAPRRGENVPPPGYDSSSRHRATPSQEDISGSKRGQGQTPGQRPPRAGGSPSRRPQQRARRNSESSVMDFDAAPLNEEEKKMIRAKRERERQRRERAEREGKSGEASKEGRERHEPREAREPRPAREGREGKSRDKSGRPSRRMDIIDQLDATSIYGTGLFHHDGPFDALNAHRNRSNRKAPMEAFPKNSLNNTIGGSGPLNANPDHATFMGTANDEAFREFSHKPKNSNGYTYPVARPGEAPIFDPGARVDPVHGDESGGLGTSTFLEGTPAARTAIARHREEQTRDNPESGGLQRKKSLAQRIRHINKGPRDPNVSYRSPEAASAGVNGSENNPFFSEYGKGEDLIDVGGRDGAMSPSSPPRYKRRPSGGGPLERRATTDATSAIEEGSKPSGFIGRMKSLKGGRRPRNTEAATTPPMAPPPNPGTAL